MCGRYQLALPGSTVAKFFRAHATQEALDTPATWNAAPTQMLPVLQSRAQTAAAGESEESLEVALAKWGFTTATKMSLLINARVETVLERRSFKGAVYNHRVLVPATAFYEWKKLGDGQKIPYSIGVKSSEHGEKREHTYSQGSNLTGPDPLGNADADRRELFVMAAIMRKNPSIPQIENGAANEFVILTTEANSACAPIHARMPVILSYKHAQAWLHADAEDIPELVHSIKNPMPSSYISSWPVSDRVNSVRNNDSGLAERVQISEADRLF